MVEEDIEDDDEDGLQNQKRMLNDNTETMKNDIDDYGNEG